MNTKNKSFTTFTRILVIGIIGFAIILTTSILKGNRPNILSRQQSAVIAPMASTTPNPEGTQSIEEIITLKAIGEATYLASTPTRLTPVYLPTGLYDDERVHISAGLLFIDAQNAWGGFFEGNRFSLYAGALQSDPEQGVIGLVISLPGGKSIEKFITPTKHGALSVVSVQDDRIKLVALDGTNIFFDLPTRQFVSSQTEIAPSVTPSPPVTPVPTELPYPPQP